jgi:hypothetical protein
LPGLPRRQNSSPEWQTAIQVLMLVTESGGPTMMARIGMMQTLNVGKLTPPPTGRKTSKKQNRRLNLPAKNERPIYPTFR